MYRQNSARGFLAFLNEVFRIEVFQRCNGSSDQWIVIKTNILQCIVHHKGTVIRDGMFAEGNTRSVIGRIESLSEKKSLTIPVHNTDKRDRNIKQFTGQPG